MTNWSIACAAVSRRVRELPEFQAARSAVFSGAALDIGEQPKSDAIRSLGGYSAIILRRISELPESFNADRGSKLVRCSIVSELTSDVPQLRDELQALAVRRYHAKGDRE